MKALETPPCQVNEQHDGKRVEREKGGESLKVTGQVGKKNKRERD